MAAPNGDESRTETEDAIMEATYRALCTHGYADLTIQHIGDEFDKSKSLLYHHYEGKDDLLLEFLSSMLDDFRAEFERGFEDGEFDPDGPREAISDVLAFSVDGDPDLEYLEFEQAMVELRAQAAHDSAYEAYFTRSDRVFIEQWTSLLSDALDAEGTTSVDPERAAEHLHTLIVGMMTRRATADEVDVDAIRAEAESYVSAWLAGDG